MMKINIVKLLKMLCESILIAVGFCGGALITHMIINRTYCIDLKNINFYVYIGFYIGSVIIWFIFQSLNSD